MPCDHSWSRVSPPPCTINIYLFLYISSIFLSLEFVQFLFNTHFERWSCQAAARRLFLFPSCELLQMRWQRASLHVCMLHCSFMQTTVTSDIISLSPDCSISHCGIKGHVMDKQSSHLIYQNIALHACIFPSLTNFESPLPTSQSTCSSP